MSMYYYIILNEEIITEDMIMVSYRKKIESYYVSGQCALMIENEHESIFKMFIKYTSDELLVEIPLIEDEDGEWNGNIIPSKNSCSHMTGPFGMCSRVDVTYPDSVTEVFTYKLVTLVTGTITVTYLTSSKDDILSVVYDAL